MSEFNRVSISESSDDAYKIDNAQKQLGQPQQDHWGESHMGVRVGDVRDVERMRLNADDVLVEIPDSAIHPFPDVEAMLQARAHPNYERSAAYRNFVDRCIYKTQF
jgi:hypothetical protein